MTSAPPAVSIIVPVSERSDDLEDIYSAFAAPFRDVGWGFEFVFVLEPWARHLKAPLERLARSGEPIQVIDAGRVLGEAGQLKLAVDRCRAPVLLTLPAYYRIEPVCLPQMVRALEEQSADLVIARRWPRRDAWLNRLQNRLFGLLVNAASEEGLHDIGCGVRAMRAEVLRDMPLYGDFSRFLPLLAAHEGFVVSELPCAQHPRDRRMRVYSPGTYLRRAIDLFGIFFLVRFTYKPLRFFGLIGSALSLVGGAILVVLLVQRLMGQALAGRPLLLLGVLLFALGIQIVALGLIGELIVYLQAPVKPSYRVRERV